MSLGYGELVTPDVGAPLMVPQAIINHLAAEVHRAERMDRCGVLVFETVTDRLTVTVCMRKLSEGTHDHGDQQRLDWQ